MKEDIVILGAGLAGLSTAYHLQKGYSLYEMESEPGGMARSLYRGGYTFDYDGHLLHFRQEYAFKLVSDLLGGNLAPHKRSSWIYSKGNFTRYPFQANFYGLPKPIVKDCLLGLIKAKLALTPTLSPQKTQRVFCGEREKGEGGTNGNFENWIRKTFGNGIADNFMLPYNRKFWRIEPRELTCDWLDGFVPVPTLEDTITGAISDSTKPYGYNSRFWYPVKGGISELAAGFLDRVKNAHFNKKAVTIDQYRHEIIFEDGTIKSFKKLVTTIPLPELFKLLVKAPERVRDAFSMLRFTSIFILNMGIKRDDLSEKHWIYYPEDNVVFYRIGFPANFSMDVAPQGRTSAYIEMSYSHDKEINRDMLTSDAIDGLKKTGIISDENEIEVCLPVDIKYGYALYDCNRKQALHVITDYLKRFNIFPTGRYGSWRYMSMEDVILEGREIASALRSQ
ncbi:MAG: FAD-dependent oxidoreductase [Candidatus Omnitrophica bacterium]|nr:FAD-dependent oxidoreductase [Candidatus Omnitrophota bacterium]MBU4590072.1 FAD-dependent oxidoreductase [Candidatus Omnitrophota bacterium]